MRATKLRCRPVESVPRGSRLSVFQRPGRTHLAFASAYNADMSEKPIYLDNNATTPLHPKVAEEMRRCGAAQLANPASQHEAGRRARHVLEDTRDRIAEAVGAKTDGASTDQVIFTSGATEANNLAIRGLAGTPPGEIIVSAIEHPSVMLPAQHLAQNGFKLRILPVDGNGVSHLSDLEALVSKQTRLVCLMLGNNETGALQPVAAIAGKCRELGIPVHTDAVQVAGKLPISFRKYEVATMSISAHKFHGPRGIAMLVVRHGTQLSPLMFGGFQQSGLRPGSETIELPVGLLKALDLFHENQPERIRHLCEVRDRFEAELSSRWPTIVINSAAAERLPHTSNISFPGFGRQGLLMALDREGVACATGSSCASGSTEPSPVLRAMCCDEKLLHSALRFSFGAFNTVEEVDESVNRIVRVLKDLQSRSRSRKSPRPAPRRASKGV